ncbi:Arf-GAP domain and FG repeat-containing protein 1 [Rhynchospora pubera]|uniref:Arf-GAP domain and FG repeat-containing protein 1 n=1 Tax=Rhynchospora pubera TaxID=906938 RepID=A0AAV8GML7_9POAL|nr:Arf-GAP domain and FG repeat-containing protein 1 [Rhynchospora pubera]
MASRLKEDEKNEKILRGLSKLPANRRCINCNSQGTQYVCTNFATFICINCSGIHREFTHRVKSISMAKFTPQEITALQEGGNERAKGIYFKGWDFERQSLPDSSDIDKLRDFIKHVYVDQRFAGERNVDKPPVVKVGKETLNQERSQDSEQSPKKDKTAPVNETSNSSFATRQESMGSTSRVVKDDPVTVPPAKILGPPKLDTPSTPRAPTPVAPVQSIETSSNIKDKSAQNPPEVKMVPTISLIDFDSDPEPVPRQQTATANKISDVGWASFDTQKPSFTQDHLQVLTI